MRKDDWRTSLMDRLLVTALIEARSCERFEILANNCGDAELEEFYTTLEACESGHYRIFFKLAKRVADKPTIDARWKDMLQAESDIIQRQSTGPWIHSGVAAG